MRVLTEGDSGQGEGVLSCKYAADGDGAELSVVRLGGWTLFVITILILIFHT